MKFSRRCRCLHHLLLVVALSVLAIPADSDAQQQDSVRPLSDALSSALEGFQTPGGGIVVVREGRIMRGEVAGVTRVGGTQSVDMHTIFPIGSNAKGFTATLIAMLVEEGRLSWDDPVRKHLPTVRFADPYLTEHATVRDLLAMRTGVANDLMWLGSDFTKEDILSRIPLIEPVAPFRARWIYSNINYLLAGEIVERLTGQSWAEALRVRIFEPLGMTESSTGVANLQGRNTVAQHVVLHGQVHAVDHPDVSAVAPAGDINSTLTDMVRWVHFQLTGEGADGRQLLSAALLEEIRSPQILMTGFSAYGMGWRALPTYRGEAVEWAFHDGSTLAAISAIALLPSMDAGVVVLANRGEPSMAQALMLHAVDEIIGAEPRDHVSAAIAERPAPTTAPHPDRTATPPLAMQSYMGVYESPTLGLLDMVQEEGRLVVRRGRWVGDLFWVEDDRFTVEWRDPYLAALGSATAVFDIRGRTASAVTLFGTPFKRSAGSNGI